MCKNCEYFESASSTKPGVCRLRPPVIVIEYHTPTTVWPKVYRGDWCSEFSQRVVKPGEEDEG